MFPLVYAVACACWFGVIAILLLVKLKSAVHFALLGIIIEIYSYFCMDQIVSTLNRPEINKFYAISKSNSVLFHRIFISAVAVTFFSIKSPFNFISYCLLLYVFCKEYGLSVLPLLGSICVNPTRWRIKVMSTAISSIGIFTGALLYLSFIIPTPYPQFEINPIVNAAVLVGITGKINAISDYFWSSKYICYVWVFASAFIFNFIKLSEHGATSLIIASTIFRSDLDFALFRKSDISQSVQFHIFLLTLAGNILPSLFLIIPPTTLPSQSMVFEFTFAFILGLVDHKYWNLLFIASKLLIPSASIYLSLILMNSVSGIFSVLAHFLGIKLGSIYRNKVNSCTS
jgi:hypothetical protein